MTDTRATPPPIEFAEVEAVPTVVVAARDYPMGELPTLFDSTFRVLFPALAERGIAPAGAAFSLYHRSPGATADLEVGIPVATALTEPITVGDVVLTPSTLPAGSVATASHLGSYDGLGDAWGNFMAAIVASGRAPSLPFWEVYVTEPRPDMDPATLRTDLVTLVSQG